MRRNNQRNASSEGHSRGAFPFRLFSLNLTLFLTVGWTEFRRLCEAITTF